jgi:predicted nucleic acid-binding Zn ribbon protein
MQRAGRVLRAFDLATDEQVACAAWPSAVGKKIAVHTRAIQVVRTRLVIEVEDTTWQRQLFSLRQQILARLEQVLGKRSITELEFRVGVPKRAPQRAEAGSRLLDEADSITDPILRSLYRASRKRAQA